MHTLQHLNDSGDELDKQSFDDWGAMESYIDKNIIPCWEKGDSIICDGVKRDCFNDYELKGI